MKRTSIMLPQDLKARAARYADRRGVSLGRLIRDSLEERISRDAGPKEDPFFADAFVFRGRSPKDLARNHDRHLYGEKG